MNLVGIDGEKLAKKVERKPGEDIVVRIIPSEDAKTMVLVLDSALPIGVIELVNCLNMFAFQFVQQHGLQPMPPQGSPGS